MLNDEATNNLFFILHPLFHPSFAYQTCRRGRTPAAIPSSSFIIPMITRYSDFEASLQKGRFYPTYFFFGSDAFLIEQAWRALARAVEAKNQAQSSLVTLDLDEVSLDELLNSAQSLSMFAPRQLILVKGAMKLRENQGKRLASYFANPNPQTVLIFLAGDLDRDQRKKRIFEILNSGTKVVELAPLEARELTAWIERHLGSRGFSIDAAGIDFLLEVQGNDLGRLHQELEKAMVYAGPERLLNQPILEAVSGFAAGHTLSEFIEAVTSRNKRKALGLIGEIFFSGKETGLAFWWFGQQLRQWLQFNELAGRIPPSIIGKQAGVYNPVAATKVMNQARQFSRPSLLRALGRLAEVDDKMKGSSVDAQFTMELLVHELTK
jgi:DNA polymerase III subunit delta